MKVIIVTRINGSFPFVNELSLELRKKEIEVEIFDMFEMYTLKFINNNEQIYYHLNNQILRKISTIRIFGTIFRYFYYKLFLLFNPLKCDHISIHYVLPFYSFFIKSFKKNTTSLSCCIWGSDFYRVNKNDRIRMLTLFEKSDSIILCNKEMSNEFAKYYKNMFNNKIVNSGFGISKLDLINNLSNSFLKNELKNELGFPIDKLLITIGYNGIPAQQHLYVLESIFKIPSHLLTNIFIIIPFGYGGDETYKNLIINKIQELGVGYKLIESFISDEDVAKIRICTDFVINAQTTDAASASLQEHLYCGNVLLAGNWLPYNYFTENGITFWSFKKDELVEKITDILVNFPFYSSQVKSNSESIYKLSSWNFRIVQWVNVFKSY